MAERFHLVEQQGIGIGGHHMAAAAIPGKGAELGKKITWENYGVAPSLAIAHGHDAVGLGPEEIDLGLNGFGPKARLIRYHKHGGVHLLEGVQAQADGVAHPRSWVLVFYGNKSIFSR